MRLLADENVPQEAIDGLRQLGHEVVSVRETMSGAGDRQILAIASREGYTLLTFDRDFGELVFRQRLEAVAGVILMRIASESKQRLVAIIEKAISQDLPFDKSLTVVEADRIRCIPLPS